MEMIKVGQRDCILSEADCVPFELISRIQFQHDYLEAGHPIASAKIHLLPNAESDGTGAGPIKLDEAEARGLKKLLSMLGT